MAEVVARAAEALATAGAVVEMRDPAWPEGTDETALMPLQLAGLAALHSAAFRADPACFDPDIATQIEQGLATPGSAVAAALLQRETRRNRPACCSRSGRPCSPSGLSPRGGVRLRCRRSPLWRGRSGSGACRWSSPPGKPGRKGTDSAASSGQPFGVSARPSAAPPSSIPRSPSPVRLRMVRVIRVSGVARLVGSRTPSPSSTRVPLPCMGRPGARDDRAQRNRRQRRLDRRWQGGLKCRSQPRGGEMLMRPPRRQRVARREERRRFWTSNAADLSSEDAAIRSTRVW